MLLVVGKLADHSGRTADDQAAGWEALAFGDERPGPDDALPLDHRAVENLRAHPDQAIVGYGAAVEDRLVSDGDAGADRQRKSGIAVADRAVLEVAVLADQDRRVVGTDDGAEPDAGASAKLDVADEVGRWRRPGAVAEPRGRVADS